MQGFLTLIEKSALKYKFISCTFLSLFSLFSIYFYFSLAKKKQKTKTLLLKQGNLCFTLYARKVKTSKVLTVNRLFVFNCLAQDHTYFKPNF